MRGLARDPASLAWPVKQSLEFLDRDFFQTVLRETWM